MNAFEYELEKKVRSRSVKESTVTMRQYFLLVYSKRKLYNTVAHRSAIIKMNMNRDVRNV